MKMRSVANSSRRKTERGSVLAYTVISVLFLFFAVGLGVDLSHLYLAKTELQNTADAAALAGASALAPGTSNRINTAVDRALNLMNLNKYNFNNKNYVGVMTLAAQRNLVEFAKNLSGPYKTEGALTTAEGDAARFVRVQTPTVPINVFFSIPILGVQRNLSAQATAGLSIPGNVFNCPLPLAVVDCGTDPNCSGLGGVCNAAGPAPNPDGTACNPDKQLCKNCTYTIRAQPSGGPAPGNYQALCCGGGTCNAEWLKHALAGTENCDECPPVSPGDEITPNTNPGQKQAAIRDGLNTRLDCYGPNCTGGGGGVNPTDHPPDPNVFGKDNNGAGNNDNLTWAEYKAQNPFQAPTNPDREDRRILVLQITPFSSWTDVNGSSTVTVSNFGGFFLKQRVPNGSGPLGGDIRAEYIGDEVISALGYDPNNTTTTNVVTWVLYR